MPLPEALAIISFSLGIVTFSHNGIITIRGERDDWKKARGYLVDVERKLYNIERRVVAWRKQWIVPAFSVTQDDGDRIDYSPIFHHLWGTDWTNISACLKRIDEEIKRFRPFLTRIATQRKLFAKLNMSLGGKKKIDKWLDTIEDNLNELERESINLFREKCAGNDDTIRDELRTIGDSYIKRIITEHVFVRLANITSKFSSYLYTSCAIEHEVLAIRLLIDLFGAGVSQEPLDPKRQETIFRTFALIGNKSLDFHFLMKGTHPTFMGTKVHGSNVEVKNLRNTMSLAFDHVWEGIGNVCSGFATERVWFSVEKDNIPNSGRIPDSSSSIDHLCNGLLAQPRALDPTRAKLAYLLAEFGLLLLKTPWVLGICRCRLRRMTLSQREEYLIVPLFIGIPTEYGNNGAQTAATAGALAEPSGSATPSPTCWCSSTRRPYGDRHLPYLGLLLAEIAIGQPIMVSATADSSPSIRIEGSETSVDNLTQRVQRATGSEIFANAVNHCLLSGVTPEGVEDNDLNVFYQVVFVPLKKTYELLLADPVRLERHRRAMGN